MASLGLPGCPWARDETKVAFCGVGRAAGVATSDRAAGQPRAPLPSRPPGSVPSGPGSPPSVTSPALGAEQRADAQPGLPALRSPPRSPCVPRGSPASRRPRRVSRSGCCSRRGSGRCTWSRPRPSSAGSRGWAAVGTSGTGRCVLRACPLPWGLGHSGTTPSDPSACQPPAKNPDPTARDFRGDPGQIRVTPGDGSKPSPSRDGAGMDTATKIAPPAQAGL